MLPAAPTKAEKGAARIAVEDAKSVVDALIVEREELSERINKAHAARYAADAALAELEAREKLHKLPAEVVEMLRLPLPRNPDPTLIRRGLVYQHRYERARWTVQGELMRRLLGVEA